jgi:hypothetical protein
MCGNESARGTLNTTLISAGSAVIRCICSELRRAPQREKCPEALDLRPVTPEVAGSSPVGPANRKHSPAATWRLSCFQRVARESCNSQADSQGRDSRARKPSRKPPRKREMFDKSERMLHGKSSVRRRNPLAIGDGTVVGMMRGRAHRSGPCVPFACVPRLGGERSRSALRRIRGLAEHALVGTAGACRRIVCEVRPSHVLKPGDQRDELGFTVCTVRERSAKCRTH